ncbi:hypothetical protein B0I35DRAFT_513928 [Stachybotrys elegans]|uniref:Uncharacterized protein n=1 Tax=Stachybotrys elegans TaxID=80388 RepID=A0A8K0SQZ2_9HYPO|nr:hypothetical protein B0I35DRAFT_513928 [Stachybotrys elegans]
MYVSQAVSTALAAGVACGHTFSETFEGFDFVKSGPTDLQPKINYEWYGAQQALAAFRNNLSPDDMLSLLSDEIAAADAYWHDVIDRSTGSWVPTDGNAIAFLPNLTAAAYAYWMRTPLWDAANALANPEHYFKRTIEVSPGVLEAEILEGWGGVITLFDVPGLGLPDYEKFPFIRRLPDFPFQVAGPKVLKDGTTFGVLHIAARDVPGEEYGQEHDGIEVRATVWYGDGVEDSHIEIERQHITTEIINNALQARKDLINGAFVFPPRQ